MSTPISSRGLALISTAAISAIGLLTVPTMANAYPPAPPLAPACTNYKFIGDYSIRQGDNWRVEFRATGPDAPGTVVTATSPTGELLRGTASTARIEGRKVRIVVNWANGWNSNYTGNADDAGMVIDGRKVDSGHPGGEIQSWSSTVPLGCADASAPPPPEPTNTNATVAKDDVDVADVPGDEGRIIGMLNKDEVVQVAGGCRQDIQCEVLGRGWVWGDHLLKIFGRS
jgi:hypothetical protein